MRHYILLATTAIAVMAPTNAFGQTVSGASAATTAAVEPGLEDIVVTAQRRSENLQRAGLAISAVTGDTLAKTGITTAQALTNVVPSVQIAAGAGPYNLFYLRGVGSFNVNPLSDSTISFNVDGIAISRPSATSGVFYDLARVEVLKGPQGTLYGRNATGGAINVITNAPILHEFSGNLTGEYGNYDTVRVNGAINIPLGDKAAIRAAFMTADHDGYMSDGTDDQKDRAGRVRFKLEATPDITIQLGTDYYHQGGRGAGGAIVAGDFVKDRIGNTDPRAQAYYAGTLYFPAGSFLSPLPADARASNDYWGVNGSFEWRNALGTLTVLPAFRRNALDYRSTVAGLHIIENNIAEQSSIEARFASKDNQPLRWLAGVYYLNETSTSQSRYNQQFNISYSNYTVPLKSFAGFGRLTYTITDRFRVTGGVRYTRDRKSINASGPVANILCFPGLATGNPFACLGTPGFPYDGVALPEVKLSGATGFPVPYGNSGASVVTTPVNEQLSKAFSKVTWRISTEFDVAPRSLLYASVETGFKAGGFYFGNVQPIYQPETITAYTLGSKNRFLDNRLQVNVEAFYWKYKNQQVSHIGQDATGAVVFATENVGKATIKGAEAEIQFSATRSTKLGANLQYLDATYDSFFYTVPNLGAPPVPNCPFTASGAVFVVNCSGRSAPQSPKWTLNLNAQQTISLGSSGEVVLNVATKYQTRIFVGLEYLNSQRQSGYWMSNAQLTYNLPGDRLSLSGFIDNIENVVVKTSAFPHPLVGAALVSSSVRPPRTYGLRASVRF